ncbi:phosphoglucosamine mutase [Salinisphaera sp. USBA-960]|uniref:phosphoglucosamine mutase n=1 Tax=Salinisphaera orenii TaxID=856731 RepID=UPI000DBE9119|nr:phosphoglucosamine mutase [Salifodinibacter halophilus]NNC25534.1 phosphoglucosamine mutase [Salifodinibacter halophilus]
MGESIFGTDGIRGRVGSEPMTPDFALRLGFAAGSVLLAENYGATDDMQPCVLIGKDTRLSGDMLESALESGFAAAGVDVLLVGTLPTPGIAHLTRTYRAAAGLVISASHNPHYDNGFKFFSPRGQKLSDAIESRIAAALDQPLACVPSGKLGRASRVDSAAGRYVEFCKSTARLDLAGLRGLKLVVDCANGAMCHVAPSVFRELNAEVKEIATEPDGQNINRECGSTNPEGLASAVIDEGADVGIAFDGDGDRCIMIDHCGRVIDGDDLLYVIAAARHARGALRGPVVGTVMTNLGVVQAFERAGIDFERAPVGDRYVFERLEANGGEVGGEASGHVLCLDRATTGDGVVTALQTLAIMIGCGRSLADLTAGLVHHPNALVNVELAPGEADRLMQHPQVLADIERAEAAFEGAGRVLLRASGTEHKLRVMVEGPDQDKVYWWANELAAGVRGQAAHGV